MSKEQDLTVDDAYFLLDCLDLLDSIIKSNTYEEILEKIVTEADDD